MKRSTPVSHQKKFDLNRSTFICHWTKEGFDSSIDGNLQVLKNHRKQAKINVVFHLFSSLSLSEPPWVWIF